MASAAEHALILQREKIQLERKLRVATEALTGIRHACEEGLDVPYCTIISVRGRANVALAQIDGVSSAADRE